MSIKTGRSEGKVPKRRLINSSAFVDLPDPLGNMLTFCSWFTTLEHGKGIYVAHPSFLFLGQLLALALICTAEDAHLCYRILGGQKWPSRIMTCLTSRKFNFLLEWINYHLISSWKMGWRWWRGNVPRKLVERFTLSSKKQQQRNAHTSIFGIAFAFQFPKLVTS